jgi:hypothetical protein
LSLRQLGFDGLIDFSQYLVGISGWSGGCFASAGSQQCNQDYSPGNGNQFFHSFFSAKSKEINSDG